MELLIATHNKDKKREIQEILPGYKITSLRDYDLNEEIVEDGDSFRANAKIKATYCFEKTGKPSLGDDSGLVIDALNGEPGIYSARYAGDHDSKANNQKVLKKLEGIERRTAYFVTVLCFIDDDRELYFEGRVYGQIALEEKGNAGFGYDPIFIPNGYDQTFAEMGEAEKNKISHRANALKDFQKYLQTRKS